MLAKRIIPCLDIKDGQTVKGTNFVNLRQAGDPVELGKAYSEQGADELVYLDITASHEGRKTFTELVKRISAEINIPFTVGGGIHELSDVERLLNAGADKVSINSSAIRNPQLIDDIARHFGSQVCVVAIDARQTPQGWNGSIFSLIQNLSNSVIVPIAGVIITFVLCYELITMLTEKNNMHEIDTWMFFKYFFKMWVAVYLVSNTFTIAMAVFDVGQHVVNAAGGSINSQTAINVDSMIEAMNTAMESMEIGELVTLALETMVVSLCMKVMSVLITVILFGRMIEIYLYTSIAPIPFATMSNREWGQVGTNYFRGLLALGFQGFFMMVCVGIYAVLVSTIQISDNMHSALFGVAAYTVILCFSLMKTGNLSRSIFNAH